MNTSETFWLTVLVQVQTAFILVGVVIFLTIPRPGKREFLELGLVLVLTFTIEVVSSIGIHIIHTNMNLAVNIYSILNLPLVVLLYRKQIHWTNRNSIAAFIIISFVLFTLINLFFIQLPFNFNSYSTALASVYILVISLTYFYVLIQQLPAESITKLPMFWINTAMLVNYSGTFFVYLTADYLITVLKNDLIDVLMIHHFIGLIFHSILWYALLLIRSENVEKPRVASSRN